MTVSPSTPTTDRRGAVALIAVGAAMLVAWLVPDGDRFLLASIAGICLAAFATTRDYGFAVAAGVTGGIGAGILGVTTFSSSSVAGPIFLSSMAAGFLAVWVLGLLSQPREAHPWPLAPAGIIGAVALTAATGSDLVIDVATMGVALTIIVVGVGLLVRSGRSER